MVYYVVLVDGVGWGGRVGCEGEERTSVLFQIFPPF